METIQMSATILDDFVDQLVSAVNDAALLLFHSTHDRSSKK